MFTLFYLSHMFDKFDRPVDPVACVDATGSLVALHMLAAFYP